MPPLFPHPARRPAGVPLGPDLCYLARNRGGPLAETRGSYRGPRRRDAHRGRSWTSPTTTPARALGAALRHHVPLMSSLALPGRAARGAATSTFIPCPNRGDRRWTEFEEILAGPRRSPPQGDAPPASADPGRPAPRPEAIGAWPVKEHGRPRPAGRSGPCATELGVRNGPRQPRRLSLEAPWDEMGAPRQRPCPQSPAERGYEPMSAL